MQLTLYLSCGISCTCLAALEEEAERKMLMLSEGGGVEAGN